MPRCLAFIVKELKDGRRGDLDQRGAYIRNLYLQLQALLLFFGGWGAGRETATATATKAKSKTNY